MVFFNQQRLEFNIFQWGLFWDDAGKIICDPGYRTDKMIGPRHEMGYSMGTRQTRKQMP